MVANTLLGLFLIVGIIFCIVKFEDLRFWGIIGVVVSLFFVFLPHLTYLFLKIDRLGVGMLIVLSIAALIAILYLLIFLQSVLDLIKPKTIKLKILEALAVVILASVFFYMIFFIINYTCEICISLQKNIDILISGNKVKEVYNNASDFKRFYNYDGAKPIGSLQFFIGKMLEIVFTGVLVNLIFQIINSNNRPKFSLKYQINQDTANPQEIHISTFNEKGELMENQIRVVSSSQTYIYKLINDGDASKSVDKKAL